jgi:hypothetical protein
VWESAATRRVHKNLSNAFDSEFDLHDYFVKRHDALWNVWTCDARGTRQTDGTVYTFRLKSCMTLLKLIVSL